MNKNFESWPIGRIPKHLQRIELEQVKELGYKYNDARELVTIFEETIAKFSGSKYAIAVDNCTDALFLCLEYLKEHTYPWGKLANPCVTLPSRIYPSTVMSVIQTGHKVKFEDVEWSGIFQLKPYTIYDSAVRFTKGMYIQDSYQCLSFQLKKRLFTGKGGMILLNDKAAYDYLYKFKYQGRNLEVNQWDDEYSSIGYNMYFEPESAARSLIIFDYLMKENPTGVWPDTATHLNYADMSKKKIFQQYIVK